MPSRQRREESRQREALARQALENLRSAAQRRAVAVSAEPGEIRSVRNEAVGLVLKAADRDACHCYSSCMPSPYAVPVENSGSDRELPVNVMPTAGRTGRRATVEGSIMGCRFDDYLMPGPGPMRPAENGAARSEEGP